MQGMITSLQIAAYTHTGLYRKRNEDSLLIADQVITGVAMDKPRVMLLDSFPILFAVADGIGGSVGGNVASREIMGYLADSSSPENEDALRSLIISSGNHLDKLALNNPVLEGLGTTLAGVLIAPERALIFSCGDSRVYYSPPEKKTVTLITKDHSVIQEMIDAGTLTEKEARSHPLGHVITSCLTGGRIRRIPDIRIYKQDITEGSRLVICTDGVWDYGGDAFLKATLLEGTEKAAGEIVDACFDAGAPDNFTFIIVDILR